MNILEEFIKKRSFPHVDIMPILFFYPIEDQQKTSIFKYKGKIIKFNFVISIEIILKIYKYK